MLKTTDNAPGLVGSLRALIDKWRTGRGQRALLFARDLGELLEFPDPRTEPGVSGILEAEDVASYLEGR